VIEGAAVPRTSPGWPIRDQAADHPSPCRSSEEQGEVLADVIRLAEAISQGKDAAFRRQPLRMPLFPRRVRH
jgi:hypothetical protein